MTKVVVKHIQTPVQLENASQPSPNRLRQTDTGQTVAEGNNNHCEVRMEQEARAGACHSPSAHRPIQKLAHKNNVD